MTQISKNHSVKECNINYDGEKKATIHLICIRKTEILVKHSRYSYDTKPNNHLITKHPSLNYIQTY